MQHIAVFWLDAAGNNPQAELFIGEAAQDPMGLALKKVEALRRSGMRHVNISSENSDQVGKPGVDSIVDGKTPSGHDYTWKKRRL